MQSAYPHSPAGGAHLPTSWDNSIQLLPAVFFPNNMQIGMFAARSPWELTAPHDIVEELNDYVVKRLKELREKENSGSHLSSKGCPNDNNDSPLLQSHCNTFDSVDCQPTSSTCDKEDAERQRSLSCDQYTTTTATTTEAGEEFSSKASEANAETNAELTTKSEEKSDTSASERISTEYPHIINEAAATCTKTEEERPAGILTAVSGGTCDDLTVKSSGLTVKSSGLTVKSSGLTDKSPGLTLSCSSSQQESKVRRDRIIEDQDVNVHKQKTAGHQQHCPVSSKEATAHSSADRILINDVVTANQNKRPVYNQTNCKNTGTGVSSGVCSQVDLSHTYAECTPLSGRVDKDSPSVTVLKDPQYEDISDAEDIESELHTKLPEHEELHLPLRLEDPDYEDISEDENPPIQNMDVEEMPSARHCSCPRFDDNTECVSSAVCDRAACGPSSDLKDEDETDDEMDDDWDIIPLIITEVTLELPKDEPDPEDVVSDVGEQRVDNVTLCELHRPPPVQVPATAFSQIEVFDTCESFQLAKAVQFGKFPQNLSEESLPPEREPKSHHSRRVSYHSEDSCETDDSCNYSPVEERNHLTVSAKLLNSLPAPSLTLTSSDSDSNDKVDDVATNMQNNPSRSRQNDIIILNSDTEDECDQVCTNDARRQKRLFSRDKVSAAAAPCRPQKRDSSETSVRVKENSSKGQLLPAQCMTADSAQLCENLAIPCERVQHDVTQHNVSDGESVIVIDSDNEDDSSQNYKAKRKREFCSEWAGASEYESGKGKVEECRQSADLLKVQHDSRDSQHSPEEMQDTCSDLSHSIKRGQLPEAKTGSVCVQQKTNTQMTSTRFHESKHVVRADKLVKKKAKTKRRRRQSSEPGDGDSAFINVLLKRPRVGNKSQQNESSKDSVIQKTNPNPNRPQSGTNREADTTAVACSPVIPRLLNQNFAQDSRPLKLSKCVSYRRDKDASSKKHPTSKNLHSCQTKTQLLHGDAQVKFVSNPKPADERHPQQCLTHVTSLSKESSSPPRKMSPLFKLQRPDPFNIVPSTSIPSYTPTKGPSAMTQVTNKWRESYYSTRKDKKTSVVMEEGLRPKNNHDLPKEAKPGRSHCDRAPRRRNSSQESATPLMKRTIVEARELTKARNRDASWDQLGHRVGEGYKWRK